MKPMKGAHLVLNDAILEFLAGALDDIGTVYTDEEVDQDPESTIKGLLEIDGWSKEKDKFGTKVFCQRVYPVNGHDTGELRVTVVLKANGELMLDIRPWGDY